MGRLNYELEEETVTVVPLRDYTNLRLDGMLFNLIEGRKAEIPLWIAEILENRGYVFIENDIKGVKDKLRRIFEQEREYGKLVEMDSLLFRRVRTQIDKLRNDNNESSVFELRTIEALFHRIINRRLKKIFRSIIAEDGDEHHLKLFTREEQWLVDRLKEMYSSWVKSVGYDSTKGRN
jgi:hypothetical protein